MKLNTLMIITAAITFIFGLGFILAPGASMALYGHKLDIIGEFLGRYLGASLLALALVAWYTRNTTSRGLLVGYFSGMVLGLLVSLYDALAGDVNALVWLNVVIYAGLGIGFGYFVFSKSSQATIN